MRVMVTDSQIRSWRLRGYSLERIASACGWTTSRTLRRIQRIWQAEQSRSVTFGDPGPDEIRRACEEIQAGWSPEERQRRVVGRRESWRPAVVPASLLERARG